MQSKFKCGIEIHIEITKNINSKLFCNCSNKWQGKEPNTLTCPTCISLPGSKPIANEKAINEGIKVALALNCKVSKEFYFSRKVYSYPDLSSGFQRTQFEVPIASKGFIQVDNKTIRIKRINLEEDPGRLIHKGSYALIDYNRSGTPLLEIVTEPDFTSTREVRIFLQKLSKLLESYLGVFNSKLDGTLRADINISTSGERVELKNITSFKDVESSLEYEIERQKKEKVTKQETRGWNPETKSTFLQRTKETESDYGFIIDTDLPKFEISKELISQLKYEIPELGLEKASRFQKQYNLKKEDSEILASEKRLAELFEEVAKKINPELAAKWLIRDLQKIIHYNKTTINEINLETKHIIELLDLFEKNKITDKTAKDLLIELIKKPFSPKEYVKKHNLEIVSGNLIENMCKEVVKENHNAVEDYKKGNEKSIHFLTGQVMRKSKGTANPKEVEEIIKKLIK